MITFYSTFLPFLLFVVKIILFNFTEKNHSKFNPTVLVQIFTIEMQQLNHSKQIAFLDLSECRTLIWKITGLWKCNLSHDVFLIFKQSMQHVRHGIFTIDTCALELNDQIIKFVFILLRSSSTHLELRTQMSSRISTIFSIWLDHKYLIVCFVSLCFRAKWKISSFSRRWF